MTRPLAAGGFFVALVPEEPFLGKYNFYGTRLTWENSVFRFYIPRSTRYRGRQSASPGVGVAESPTPNQPENPRSKPRSEGRRGSPGMTVKATEAHRRASDSVSTDFASCEGETMP